MSTTVRKQDLPPSGGYKSITYKRIPAKSYFNGWALIGMYLGTTAAASYLYFLNLKKVHFEEVEERSAQFALYPMLLAEKDRSYLNQLRKNRDEEANLMANVEGWKVGTLYGEPIYKDYGKDRLVEPSLAEYYVHSSYKDFKKRAHFKLWT